MQEVEESLWRALQSNEYTDIIFYFSGTKIRAHRLICSSHPYFSKLFNKMDHGRRIVMTDTTFEYDTEVFKALLQYVYYGGCEDQPQSVYDSLRSIAIEYKMIPLSRAIDGLTFKQKRPKKAIKQSVDTISRSVLFSTKKTVSDRALKADKRNLLNLEKKSVHVGLQQGLLLSHLARYVNESRYHDVIFIIGSKRIFGHRVLLCRVEYFRELLQDAYEVQLNDICEASFHEILFYIYTGSVGQIFKKLDFDNYKNLVQLVNKFGIQGMLIRCELALIREITANTVYNIYLIAKSVSWEFLRRICEYYISSHKPSVISCNKDHKDAIENIKPVKDLGQDIIDYYSLG